MNKGINFNSNWSNKDLQQMSKFFIANYSKQLGRKIPFKQSEIVEPQQLRPEEFKKQWLQEQQDDLVEQLKKSENN